MRCNRDCPEKTRKQNQHNALIVLRKVQNISPACKETGTSRNINITKVHGRERNKKTAQWMFTKVSNASHLLHQRKFGSRDFRVTMCYGSLEVTAMDVTGIVTGIFECQSNGCHSNDCHSFISQLREVSHESVVFTSLTFRFWGKSRMRTSFSHIFNFPFLRQVSHENFIFTSLTFRFW